MRLLPASRHIAPPGRPCRSNERRAALHGGLFSITYGPENGQGFAANFSAVLWDTDCKPQQKRARHFASCVPPPARPVIGGRMSVIPLENAPAPAGLFQVDPPAVAFHYISEERTCCRIAHPFAQSPTDHARRWGSRLPGKTGFAQEPGTTPHPGPPPAPSAATAVLHRSSRAAPAPSPVPPARRLAARCAHFARRSASVLKQHASPACGGRSRLSEGHQLPLLEQRLEERIQVCGLTLRCDEPQDAVGEPFVRPLRPRPRTCCRRHIRLRLD